MAQGLPPIVFSEWFHWEQRKDVQSIDRPGVYLIALFDNSPPKSNADPADERVVYIGQTTGRRTFRTLRDRLNAFNRSVLKGSKRRLPRTADNLYGSVMPHVKPIPSNSSQDRVVQIGTQEDIELLENMRLRSPLNRAWILFVERKCILDFALRHGKLPQCNSE